MAASHPWWCLAGKSDTGVYLNQAKRPINGAGRAKSGKGRRAGRLGLEGVAEAQFLRVGVEVFHVPVADSGLGLLPEPRIKQVAVVLEKSFADLGLAKQEGGELFGKDVHRAGRIPRLAGHFHVFVGGGRNLAEIAVRHVFDFVVVVKDDSPITGHTEVLPEHVG